MCDRRAVRKMLDSSRDHEYRLTPSIVTDLADGSSILDRLRSPAEMMRNPPLVNTRSLRLRIPLGRNPKPVCFCESSIQSRSRFPLPPEISPSDSVVLTQTRHLQTLNVIEFQVSRSLFKDAIVNTNCSPSNRPIAQTNYHIFAIIANYIIST